jgi:hypothetical protein
MLYVAMVVHNNFIIGGDKKRARFRARSLWYLDDNDLRCTRILCTSTLYDTTPSATPKNALPQQGRTVRRYRQLG